MRSLPYVILHIWWGKLYKKELNGWNTTWLISSVFPQRLPRWRDKQAKWFQDNVVLTYCYLVLTEHDFRCLVEVLATTISWSLSEMWVTLKQFPLWFLGYVSVVLKDSTSTRNLGYLMLCLSWDLREQGIFVSKRIANINSDSVWSVHLISLTYLHNRSIKNTKYYSR